MRGYECYRSMQHVRSNERPKCTVPLADWLNTMNCFIQGSTRQLHACCIRAINNNPSLAAGRIDQTRHYRSDLVPQPGFLQPPWPSDQIPCNQWLDLVKGFMTHCEALTYDNGEDNGISAGLGPTKELLWPPPAIYKYSMDPVSTVLSLQH